MAKHVIEVNGQKYDATTGKPVSVSAPSAIKSTGPKHLDGFSRRPGLPSQPISQRTPMPVHTSKTQKSQTLMRKAVQKPATPAKVHAKVAAPAGHPKPSPQQPRFDSIKPGRAIRAHHVSKSELISKFGKTPAPIKAAVMPVKPAPVIARSEVSAPKPIVKSHVAAPPVPLSQKKDVFQQAIDNATTHDAPKIKKAKVHHRIAKRLHVSPRVVTFTGMTLAVLAVGSLLAYQNMPEIAMRIASARSGLNANLPGYQPAGFSLAGPIKYNSGEVTLNYKSNSDDRAFDVIQKNSSWNSETLLENFVTANKQPYQTFEANGRTIYIYGGNKATWVDGGVWFNIDGKANLNSDQLLKIADSL